LLFVIFVEIEDKKNVRQFKTTQHPVKSNEFDFHGILLLFLFYYLNKFIIFHCYNTF